jgi:hypothetical protein
METKRSSEASADIQWITRRYFPQDITLHNRRRENPKSYTYYIALIYVTWDLK